MANYIFSYDLNGAKPTHAEMDAHIEASDWSTGRILESVWYIGTSAARADVADYLASILSANDRYILVDARDMTFRKLLVSDDSIQQAWSRHS